MKSIRIYVVILSALPCSFFIQRCSGQEVFNNLVLQVFTDTGEVLITNQSASSVAFDYYEIESDAGSLDDLGWISLQNSGFSGWAEAGIPSEFLLVEANAASSTTIDPGGIVSLGMAYNSLDGIADLTFGYSIGADALNQGIVQYIGMPIPEPATLLLVGLGAPMVLGAARRRRVA